MTALRYLLALPRGGDFESIELAESPETVRKFGPALWCSDPSGICWSADRMNLVIGQLFERKTSRRVTPAPGKGTAAPMARSPETLADNYWGSYLAIAGGRSEAQVLRDPTGSMPCYMYMLEDSILLASDIGTLVAARVGPLQVDWDRLYEFLETPGVRRTATCIGSLDELPPGVIIRLGAQTRSERRVWTPSAFCGAERQIASIDAVGALREAVCATVAAIGREYRNIVVGISGGLDSSIVCAALAAADQRFTALTMYTDEPSGDERIYARLVAERTGAPLREHRYDVERIDLSRTASQHLPRPVGRPFMQEIERAYREDIAASGYDAIFTGNGGDNVFCYLHSAAPIIDRLRSAADRGGILSTFVDMCRITQCDIGTMARATLSLLFRREPSAAPADRGLLDPDRRGAPASPLLTPYLDEACNLPGKRAHIDMLMRIQNHVEGYDRHDMPPTIPALLAQPIVETCLRISSWDWSRGGINRAVAREAFRDLLPETIIARRSKSGPESLTAALFDLWRRQLRDMLLGGALRDNRVIDVAAVEAAIDDPAVTRGQLLFRLLELAEAEAWARSWSERSSSRA